MPWNQSARVFDIGRPFDHRLCEVPSLSEDHHQKSQHHRLTQGQVLEKELPEQKGHGHGTSKTTQEALNTLLRADFWIELVSPD